MVIYLGHARCGVKRLIQLTTVSSVQAPNRGARALASTHPPTPGAEPTRGRLQWGEGVVDEKATTPAPTPEETKWGQI